MIKANRNQEIERASDDTIDQPRNIMTTYVIFLRFTLHIFKNNVFLDCPLFSKQRGEDVLNPLEISELGEIIRKVRKERGLTLTDLADENISQATISNIERGVPHVHADKVEYMLEKLEIKDKLPELLSGEQQELKQIHFYLFSIQALLHSGEVAQAEADLNALALEDDHPYAATYYWLKGTILTQRKKWKQAERAFFNAIRLANQSPYGKKSNMEANSFNELGVLYYYQNDLEGALRFTESALDAFNEEGERLHNKYVFLRNKGIYLERLDRLAEGLKVVQDVWDELPQIKELETTLVFYWLRAELLRRSGLLEEAEAYAREGLELALINRNHFSMFDLWTLIGSIYLTRQAWEEAERCLQIAVSLEEKIPYKKSITTTYTRLGLLYLKQEKWGQARHNLDRAIQAGKMYDETSRLADALLVMGDYYRLQKKNNEAIPYYKQVVALAQEKSYTEKEYTAWFRLAQCWEGDNEQEFEQCTRNMYLLQSKMKSQGGKILEILA